MLNRLDDYPIHQTPDPIAVPATSDRNVYDRTWLNGYSKDGTQYFALGFAVYPHRHIADASFSTVTAGGQQHSVFASRRAPAERTDQQVGPLRLEVVEPLRSVRVIIDENDNDSGIAADITFVAHTAGLQEARQTLWSGTSRMMDATRFDQFGTWEGTVQTPDGTFAVEPNTWLGTKDRSWGHRGVGEPPSGGAPTPGGGVFFLWAPLIWDDHTISHAIFFDDIDGRPLANEAFEAPWYADVDTIPGVDVSDVYRYRHALHRLEYAAGTRWIESAELGLVNVDGSARTITLSPQLRFHMKGIGYGHPEWRHGVWRGELAVGSESIDPTQLDPTVAPNIHVQQVVTATDDQGRTGIGVLEHLVVGPYTPYGLTGATNPAP